MNGNPESQPVLRKVKQALAAGIGVLAVDGMVIALDVQDKIDDIAPVYHVPIVIAGLTLVTAATLCWREVHRTQSEAANHTTAT